MQQFPDSTLPGGEQWREVQSNGENSILQYL